MSTFRGTVAWNVLEYTKSNTERSGHVAGDFRVCWNCAIRMPATVWQSTVSSRQNDSMSFVQFGNELTAFSSTEGCNVVVVTGAAGAAVVIAFIAAAGSMVVDAVGPGAGAGAG